MSDHPENPFWRHILSNPSDALPRLAFSDWLEDRGETDRAALLRWSHGFSCVKSGAGAGAGDGAGAGTSDGNGNGAGTSDGDGNGAGDGNGDGNGNGDGDGYGDGFNSYLFEGVFVMDPGLYLVYFPTGYYPLVQVGWVYPDGADLVMVGARVVSRSGCGADWARLAREGPIGETLFHPEAGHEVRVPRQCVVRPLAVDRWREHLPTAMARHASSHAQ